VESVRGFHIVRIMHSPTAFRILYLLAGLKRNSLLKKSVSEWSVAQEKTKTLRH
jgi:hypothetical protein